MTRDLRELAGRRYDLAVVGGGIAGACIARDAARRGLAVALLERDDFASATTGASSKLLHGGLRYLRRLDLRVVRESLRERRVWANIAPPLVEPLPFLLPTTRRAASSRALFEPVLALYDGLAWDRNRVRDPRHHVPRHRFVDRDEAVALEPGLDAWPITGAMLFYDYQMPSPERLALACVRDAAEHGASVANHAPVVGLRRDAGRVRGVEVLDALGDEDRVEVVADLVVNATGPWADLLLREWLEGAATARLVRSKGIHLVTRPIAGPHAITVALEHGHVFILPWRGLSLIGTTDTRFEGRPEDCRVTEDDIAAFLDVVNGAYPAAGLSRADVRHAYAGLRPIVDRETGVAGHHAAARGTYQASRAAEIIDHGARGGPSGLITAIGGKWTTARSMAEQVVDLACRRLARPAGPCSTATGALPLAAPATHDLGARVVVAIREEMARTLADLVFRRLDLGGAGHPGEALLSSVATAAAAELRWSPGRLRDELARVSALFVTPPTESSASLKPETGSLKPETEA